MLAVAVDEVADGRITHRVAGAVHSKIGEYIDIFRLGLIQIELAHIHSHAIAVVVSHGSHTLTQATVTFLYQAIAVGIGAVGGNASRLWHIVLVGLVDIHTLQRFPGNRIYGKNFHTAATLHMEKRNIGHTKFLRENCSLGEYIFVIGQNYITSVSQRLEPHVNRVGKRHLTRHVNSCLGNKL